MNFVTDIPASISALFLDFKSTCKVSATLRGNPLWLKRFFFYILFHISIGSEIGEISLPSKQIFYIIDDQWNK